MLSHWRVLTKVLLSSPFALVRPHACLTFNHSPPKRTKGRRHSSSGIEDISIPRIPIPAIQQTIDALHNPFVSVRFPRHSPCCRLILPHGGREVQWQGWRSEQPITTNRLKQLPSREGWNRLTFDHHSYSSSRVIISSISSNNQCRSRWPNELHYNPRMFSPIWGRGREKEDTINQLSKQSGVMTKVRFAFINDRHFRRSRAPQSPKQEGGEEEESSMWCILNCIQQTRPHYSQSITVIVSNHSMQCQNSFT